MVFLTSNYILEEHTHRSSMKIVGRSAIDHLRQMSHLRMNEKFINAIGDFSVCKGLKVIYLQNNSISKIENLNFAVNLTRLYLQHNELTKIENLEGLKNLTKLCLGHNRICVVEGLENLEKLCELNIENQQLHAGEYLMFEPRTVIALSTRLKMLNVTGNRINSLSPISGITSLEILEAKDNFIDDIENLTEDVSRLRMLSELYLQGNPVTRTYRYRENLIANTDSLVNLDGKLITEICRRFMKKFKEEMQFRQNRRRSKMTLSDDITSSLKLPPAFERSVSRAIIQQHPGPKFTFNVTSASADSQPQIFPAWKSTAALARTKSNSRVASRPSLRGETISKHSSINSTGGVNRIKNVIFYRTQSSFPPPKPSCT